MSALVWLLSSTAIFIGLIGLIIASIRRKAKRGFIITIILGIILNFTSMVVMLHEPNYDEQKQEIATECSILGIDYEAIDYDDIGNGEESILRYVKNGKIDAHSIAYIQYWKNEYQYTITKNCTNIAEEADDIVYEVESTEHIYLENKDKYISYVEYRNTTIRYLKGRIENLQDELNRVVEDHKEAERIKAEEEAAKIRAEEEAERLRKEEEMERQRKEAEKQARINSLTIHKEGDTIFATANDIVYLYKNNDGISISDFDIEGKVCVTGKVKNYSVESAYYSIPVAGEYSYYSIKGTTDDLYIDNDAMQSSFGIEIDVKTEYDENNLKDILGKISVAEEYGGITNTFYVSTKFGTWVQEQKNLGKWTDSVSYIRAYGNGIAGYIYRVDDCYKVELLDNNMNVISTWISDK